MQRRKKSGFVVPLLLVVTIVVSSVIMLPGVFSKNDTQASTESDAVISLSNEEIGAMEPHEQEETLQELLASGEIPAELKKSLAKNPELKDFVLNYPAMKDESFEIDLSEYAYAEEMPLFLQWDQRWGYTPYGDDIIAVSGCGPTTLSMVCVYLLGDTSLDPKTVAEFSEANGYCVAGNGSEWTLISEGGERLGLNVEELPLDEGTIIQNLLAGNPVVCIMGPGDFTDGGHFIVMTDYIDGQIKINDCNSVIRSNKLWNYEDIKDQINNLWACSAG